MRLGGRPSQKPVVRSKGFLSTSGPVHGGSSNKRGTAEQWIKEGKLAVNWTRLSCHRFGGNEVHLWVSVIAYNLGNLWRRSALPKKIGNWSLTIAGALKTGGQLVKHARYY